DQHAGHDRQRGEVSLQERLVGADQLLGQQLPVGQLQHPIDQQDGIAVREQAPDLVDAQQSFLHRPALVTQFLLTRWMIRSVMSSPAEWYRIPGVDRSRMTSKPFSLPKSSTALFHLSMIGLRRLRSCT